MTFKVGDEWKFQVPELIVDVVDKCKKLFKLESLSVQKSLTNPFAHKFRLDIDGVVDKGQLISKCPFSVFKSTKKPTKFL